MTTATLGTPTTATVTAEQSAVTGAGPRALEKKDLYVGLAMAAASMGVTYDAWRSIADIGMYKEEFSYILLAPVMIVWIAWSAKHRWGQCRARHGWVGMVVLALGWAMFSWGFTRDPFFWRTGAVIMAVGAFLAATGADVLRRFLAVFGACVFLIPVQPNGRLRLAEPMQVATAGATQSVCDLIGVYVDRAGNMLSINGVDVTVAEACNGMRMIMTLFLVCYLVAFTSPLRPWVRVLLLLLSPVIAVVANVVRLVPTVWLFGHVSKDAAEAFHTMAGWGMIVVAFLALMGIGRFIQWVMTMDSEPKAAPVAAGGAK